LQRNKLNRWTDGRGFKIREFYFNQEIYEDIQSDENIVICGRLGSDEFIYGVVESEECEWEKKN